MTWEIGVVRPSRRRTTPSWSITGTPSGFHDLDQLPPIDIVCRDQDTLAFVEVKARTREDFGRPFDAVDRKKQRRIARGGLAWLRLLDDPDILFRFDVVEVIIVKGAPPRFELIRNAFQLPETSPR